MYEEIRKICDKLSANFIFKTSFDKANRTSLYSKRGVGLEKGLEIFSKLKEDYPDIKIITDVHLPEQCDKVAKVVDILQIPAFLCRQTDLLIAAAKTDKTIMVKKGQFISPYEVEGIIEKITNYNKKLIICERGTMFGYNYLVNDFKAMEIVKRFGYPLIFDATHSVQMPGKDGKKSSGDREMVYPLAKAAVALGVAGIFMEVHNDPENAPSDGKNMIYLSCLEDILKKLIALDNFVKTSKI
jgi:2-dehydro-3-deoxyphosphooctonate aldolase (KDO 8-P synthase)